MNHEPRTPLERALYRLELRLQDKARNTFHEVKEAIMDRQQRADFRTAWVIEELNIVENRARVTQEDLKTLAKRIRES